MREITKIIQTQFTKLLATGKNILVYGTSGEGKSSIVRQYAEDNDMILVVLNLALEVPETIGGVPYAQTSKSDRHEYFIKLLNEQLAPLFEDNGKKKILFLDEINQAPQEVMNCLYSICDVNPAQRNWAGRPLVNVQVVAAGNKTDGTDGTVYLNDLPTPLHNRFHIYELTPSREDTLNYLKKKYKNIPQVAKYITVLLDEHIPARDIDDVLDTLLYEMDALLIEAKIGPALTAKLYDIQKKAKSYDPAKAFKLCKEGYQRFKEDGFIEWSAEVLDTEEAVLEAFRSVLSEEEVASIVKGE